MLQFAIVFVGTSLLLAILSDRLRETLLAESPDRSSTSSWRTNKLLIIAVNVGFTIFFIMLPYWVALI